MKLIQHVLKGWLCEGGINRVSEGVKEGEPAVERYLNFLRGGGSKTSIDLLKGAGIDMTTPDPINAALDIFEEAVAEMEQLAG